MNEQLERLIYVDDSGRTQNKHIVYGWISFHPNRWRSVLRSWLEFRKKLWREYGVHVTKELHATDLVNGRGQLSKNPPIRFIRNGVTLKKDLGREIAEKCLETLSSIEGMTVGSVFTLNPKISFHTLKSECYRQLIRQFESQDDTTRTLSLVFVDGNGSELSLREMHRELELAKRRVIEDPIHLDSRTSQLMQMADLVAWSAYAATDGHESHEFARDWYSKYLTIRDRSRKPIRISL